MAAYPDRGLKAPEIRQYIERVRLTANFDSGRPQPTYDVESCKLIDELFSLMGRLKPYYPSGAKALWLVADRGSIEDFGDLDEYLEEEYVENAAEFEELWRAEYPEEKVWMELLAIEEERYGIRSLSLGGGRVYWQQSGVARESYVTFITPLANWLLESVKNRIAELESGTYNAQIEAELPPQHRTGTIIRKDFWDLFPEQREAFFKDLTNEEIEEFAKRVTEQPEDSRAFMGRVYDLTADMFYRYCAIGYAANHYQGSELSPREQYYRNADGRDDGLKDIDPDSPDAFSNWCQHRVGGGHPFEVCRGGNSTHISLYVHAQEDGGYLISLAGDAWNRTVETIKFYLALRRANIPVYLFEGKTLVERVRETEKIGIVPEGVFPDYCGSHFPDEHIIDFMNLPYEERDRIAAKTVWQPIKPAEFV